MNKGIHFLSYASANIINSSKRDTMYVKKVKSPDKRCYKLVFRALIPVHYETLHGAGILAAGTS